MEFVERSFELPGVGQRTYRFPTHFRQVELVIAPLLVPRSIAQRWSRVRAAGSGRYAVGSAALELGDALRRRFPGLPEQARSFLAAHVTDGELFLHLPG